MTAARLPRGRHGLSRETVAGQQRARILAALADVLTERGYVDTPVAAIIERAGVSRETFYQQFSSKQDCFVAALEQTVGELAATLATVVEDASVDPIERLDRLLAAYLDALAARPALARLFLVETYAAGEEAMRRRLALQQQFVDGITTMLGGEGEADRAVGAAVLGATIGLVTARFVAGELGDLRDVRRPVVELAAAWLAERGRFS